jgi:ADP-heptose:LPS heptosyltransferase
VSSPILIIKLGALGDFIQAAGPFAAIRAHHADAKITLLTAVPFAPFAETAPWFDEVWTDTRPKAARIGAWLALRRRLRGGRFERVYDLQTSDRSAWYFRLFWPGAKPEWSGIAAGCSHPHANPRRDLMHTIERQAEQLKMAAIEHVGPPDFSWVRSDIGRFGLNRPFALLAPGGARHRPAKRWPAANYGKLAKLIAARGIEPVILGTAREAREIAIVTELCPEARNLSGRTTIADLIALGHEAELAVGNDTGPMHPIAAAGCRSVALYSEASDPALCAQRGPAVTILRKSSMSEISVDEVVKAAVA